MSTRVGILIADHFVHTAILHSRARSWRITRQHQVDIDTPPTLRSDTDLDPIAAAIVESVRSAIRNPQSTIRNQHPVHLIIPSTWCFHQPLEATARRLDATARAYQLEEYLPLPLEDVTCAFSRPNGGPCWGLAVRTAPLRRLLDRLGQSAIHVEHLYVDSFVALAGTDLPYGDPTGLVLLSARRFVSGIRGPDDGAHTIVRSSLLPRDDDVQSAIGTTQAMAGVQVRRWRLLDLRPDDTVNVVPLKLEGQVERVDRSAAIAELQITAARRGRSLPDLCTAALAPVGRGDRTLRLATRCVAMLTLLLIVWAGDLYRQRSMAEDANHHLRQQQALVFHGVLPGRDVPAGPAMRLASERIRLEGVTRTAPETAPGATLTNDRFAAVDALRHFVASLPDDIRITLLDWNIDRSQLSVRGQTADHRDAERIAEGVNRIPGLTARPPRTSRLEGGGVTFTLRATRDRDDQERDPTLANAQ